MAEKKIMKLASRGKRFGAACIDMAFPFIAYLIMVGVLAANGVNAFSPGYGYGNDFGYGYGYGYNYGYGSSHMSGASAVVVVMLAFMLIAFAVVEFVFYAKGKSIGKAILGLQVVSSIDGKPFGFWKMVLRECIVKSACGSAFLLGYIWILIDEKNRGWHDKILDSYVVDLKESEKMNRRIAPAAPAATARVIEPAEHEEAKKPEEIKKPEEAAAAPEVKPAEAVEAPAVAEEVKAVEEVRAAEETEIEVATEVVDDAAAIAAEAAEGAEGVKAVPELSMSMKKEELLAAAKEAGVKVSSRATKAEIIEAVKNAGTEEK